ncbi:hypothetical protein Bca101_068318 [Brassica carinata]
MQKAEDEVGSDADNDGPEPKTLSVREAVLREICTPEELEVLRRASRILAEEVTDDNETGENCSESTDGSSALPITIAMPRTEGRVTGERELLL